MYYKSKSLPQNILQQHSHPTLQQHSHKIYYKKHAPNILTKASHPIGVPTLQVEAFLPLIFIYQK
jgi:hypothetical protein